jgi:hypothetical protein
MILTAAASKPLSSTSWGFNTADDLIDHAIIRSNPFG